MGVSIILSILAIFFVTVSSDMNSNTLEYLQDMINMAKFSEGLEEFGVKIFSELSKANPKKNIVIAPFAIQTCIAVARQGATGETARQIDNSLGYLSQNVDIYHKLLVHYPKTSILKMFTKLYIKNGYKIQNKYNELLSKKFFSSAKSTDFANNTQAGKTIREWGKSNTKDLVPSSALGNDTRLVLLNVIYIRGEWVHKFPARNTREQDFYTDATNTVKVQMMRVTNVFRCKAFSDLDATILELPYKDADVFMLVVLPNTRTGLFSLVEKIQDNPLHGLYYELQETKVIVDMPKFKVDFSVDLKGVLQKLGMSRMFSKNAEFGKMFESGKSLPISNVLHRAYVAVNENGTEPAAAAVAAAATGGVTKGNDTSRANKTKRFTVDHPFYYEIHSIKGMTMFKGIFWGK